MHIIYCHNHTVIHTMIEQYQNSVAAVGTFLSRYTVINLK